MDFSGHLGWFTLIEFLLIAVAIVVILLPLMLRRRSDTDFFHTPFITWYLLHSTVAGLALIGLIMLGLAGRLDGTVVAIFASLFGYLFGASASRANSPAPATPPAMVLNGAQVKQDKLIVYGLGIPANSQLSLAGTAISDAQVNSSGTVISGSVPTTSPKGTALSILVTKPDNNATVLPGAVTLAP